MDEADRDIQPETILRRTVQYGLSHYPTLSTEEHIQRTLNHLHEKYGPQGYLKLWIPGSPNERRLHNLWCQIEQTESIRQRIAELLLELKR